MEIILILMGFGTVAIVVVKVSEFYPAPSKPVDKPEPEAEEPDWEDIT